MPTTGQSNADLAINSLRRPGNGVSAALARCSDTKELDPVAPPDITAAKSD